MTALYDQEATAEFRPSLGSVRPPSPKAVEPVDKVSWGTVFAYLVPVAVMVFAVSFVAGRYLLT